MDYRFHELPYAYDALEPHISERTLTIHHKMHHRKYADTFNDLVKDTPFMGKSVFEVILATSGNPTWRALFNNAAQAWNHDFFWKCMNPSGGGQPPQTITRRLAGTTNRSRRDFKTAFIDAAMAQFGSGWAWLVLRTDGDLEIETTSNAGNPITEGKMPILTCDLWEHAYYLDYQNRRREFVTAFVDHLVDWDYALECLVLAESTEWPQEMSIAASA
jgi:superoxide dismutase, Fe-Mn family